MNESLIIGCYVVAILVVSAFGFYLKIESDKVAKKIANKNKKLNLSILTEEYSIKHIPYTRELNPKELRELKRTNKVEHILIHYHNFFELRY